jgi:RloB-like protein
MTRRSRGTYERRRPAKEPEPAILVVTEGTKTEPKYLEALRLHLHLAGTSVEVCQAAGTDPSTILEYAIARRLERLREARRGDAVAYGEVWLVFDAEHRVGTPALSDALARAKSQDVRVALSAPCFEYWLVLHFEYTTSYMCTYREAEVRLKRHVPGYDKVSPPTFVLVPLVSQAVTNAARCRVALEKSGAELPRTDVDLLVNALNAVAREHYRVF